MKKFTELLKRFFKFLLGVFTQRLWLKLISLVLALIVWTYIVSTNTALTRTKNFDGISVETGSVSELAAKTLALATDIQTEYAEAIDVTVEVPQSQYSQLTESNITLTADFSGITTAGIYEVPLNWNSTYGTVTKLSPWTIPVTIEDLVSKDITAELEIINADEENYWYNIENSSLNPRNISVSGPASIMQQVSRAVVQVDVSGRSTSIRRGYTSVSLRDSNDAEVSASLLTLSTRASVATLEIYPKKKLGLYVDQSLLHVPEGYEIVSVSFQPEIVIVAGSSDLLSSLEIMSVDVTDIQDASGTHNCKVVIPADIRYYSASEVTMTVTTKQIDSEENADE